MASSVVDLRGAISLQLDAQMDREKRTLSSFFIAFFQTHSSSSSQNSHFIGSLQTGHENGLASSPGATTTNIAFSSASCFALSSAAASLPVSGRSARLLFFISPTS